MTGKAFTFGNSIASIQLSLRLESGAVDKVTKRKIANRIRVFCSMLSALNSMPDTSRRRAFAELLIENNINHPLYIKNPIPDFDLDSTMKNVIHYRYSVWLEEYGGLIGIRQAELVESNAQHRKKSREWAIAHGL